MRTAETLVLGPKGLEVERLVAERHKLTFFVGTTGIEAKCPVCGYPSSRVHSRYTRTVADLPWHGIPVTLRIRLRRFFCDNSSCGRSPQSLLTARLQEALSLIGFALGGRAGAQLACELSLVASRDTLLRHIRRAPLPEASGIRVLGVDDWAWRKGVAYGTILVYLERRKPVDLLPNRGASSLADWLRVHPVER